MKGQLRRILACMLCVSILLSSHIPAVYAQGIDLSGEVFLGASEEMSQKDISDAEIRIDGDCTYTGSAIEPDITVTLDEQVLAADLDYTVSFADNIEVCPL